MNTLQIIINKVLEKQKQLLSPSTYDVRKNYLKHLSAHAEQLGISEPCQELFDSYVARASTADLRFQLFHAVRLVDLEAGTKAFTPDGKLYNEPPIPSTEESDKVFQTIVFPIADGCIDSGFLIQRAAKEMQYLRLSSSTNWQYMQVWRELYISLYLKGDTTFSRSRYEDFITRAFQQYQEGTLPEWKKKIQIRAVRVLLEVADTGCFKWKLFLTRKVCCQEESLEELRQQYISFLRARNLERKTIKLYDYSFRCLVEGLSITTVAELETLIPEQIQGMLISLSEKLSINSRGTIFPIIRQILTYLYDSGFASSDFSGMILTPAYQNGHLRPYLKSSDEEKLYVVMEDAPLRNKAMMRLALRLGLREIDICSMRFDQIDWRNDVITLEQEKTGVVLSLPLLEDVGNAIIDYVLNERPEDAKGYPFIFVRQQAPFKKLESMYMITSGLFNQAEVKTINRDCRGTHVCRYTLTHKLLLNKVSHQVITDTLGHVSKESDKPYLSMEEQMLRECPLDLSLIGQKYWEEGDLHG